MKTLESILRLPAAVSSIQVAAPFREPRCFQWITLCARSARPPVETRKRARPHSGPTAVELGRWLPPFSALRNRDAVRSASQSGDFADSSPHSKTLARARARLELPRGFGVRRQVVAALEWAWRVAGTIPHLAYSRRPRCICFKTRSTTRPDRRANGRKAILVPLLGQRAGVRASVPLTVLNAELHWKRRGTLFRVLTPTLAAWLLAVLICSATLSLTAATIRVEQNGLGDFTTIQGAIDAAEEGDIIDVGPGLYSERLTIRQSLSIKGAGPQFVRIKSPPDNYAELLTRPSPSPRWTSLV